MGMLFNHPILPSLFHSATSGELREDGEPVEMLKGYRIMLNDMRLINAIIINMIISTTIKYGR